MALIGVAGTQLAFFASVQRIPVNTAILVEYMAPLLLVGFAWATSRRMPRVVVLVVLVVILVLLGILDTPGTAVKLSRF